MPDDSVRRSTAATYLGPERRRFDRTPPPPYRVIGRARVGNPEAIRRLGLRRGRWYPVIEQPVESPTPAPEGHLWLDDFGRARSVSRALLEVEHTTDSEGSRKRPCDS